MKHFSMHKSIIIQALCMCCISAQFAQIGMSFYFSTQYLYGSNVVHTKPFVTVISGGPCVQTHTKQQVMAYPSLQPNDKLKYLKQGPTYHMSDLCCFTSAHQVRGTTATLKTFLVPYYIYYILCRRLNYWIIQVNNTGLLLERHKMVIYHMLLESKGPLYHSYTGAHCYVSALRVLFSCTEVSSFKGILWKHKRGIG